MPEEEDELEGSNVQLPRKQWRWLDERARRNHSSRAAVVRKLIADVMEAELAKEAAAA